MPEKVELVFRRERSKERPRELLLRYAGDKRASGSDEWQIFESGTQLNGLSGLDGAIWISFRDTFFLSSKNFITRRPYGGVHVLEHRQVDRRFFELFRYTDPGPLWELIEILKRRTGSDRHFSGPNNLRRSVRHLNDEE
jgi:hypothetical protein